jgi:cephalosporin-C deacetylase-like acetyl esterase
MFSLLAGDGLAAGTSAPAAPDDEMLHDHLLGQARQQLATRRTLVASLKTPEDFARRQKELRAFFLKSLGEFPARTPLDPHTVGTIGRDGYRIEKVVFESRPDHHVTASLYLPVAGGPVPGVLLPCGHSDNGKAYVDYQRASILLVKNGFAVLCYDPIGQGERFQLVDSKGKPVIRGTTEHTMAGLGALLVGRQLASYRIWDGLRALDYLAGRPEVDPGRLACTGNSGGGTMTSYLMALDDRISVAAPSCFITSLERLFATIGPQDAEQNITGQVAAGLDHADFITMRAPKPTLLSVGTRDFFDIQGSWDTFREVKLIYGRFGFGERVDMFESDEEHGFTSPRRVATVRWLKRWLLKDDGAAVEPEFSVLADAALQCTPTGQVMVDYKDVSVFDLNRRREAELKPQRDASLSRRSTADFRADVRNRLGLAGWKARPITPALGESSGKRTLAFEVEPGLVLPGIELLGDGKHGRSQSTLVKVGADWPRELELGQAHPALSSHRRLVLVDPRGMGKTTPKAPRGRDQSPFGADWREAYVALAIARPLLGQRAADLLDMLAGLDSQSGDAAHAGFDVVGMGAAGPVVLHAALLDERGLIKSVTLERSPVSWADVVAKGISRGQLGNVVPGVLESYDLPDLAARLAPRPLSIRAPVDATGDPVPRSIFDKIYEPCVRAYGAGGPLELAEIR